MLVGSQKWESSLMSCSEVLTSPPPTAVSVYRPEAEGRMPAAEPSFDVLLTESSSLGEVWPQMYGSQSPHRSSVA